MEILRNKHRARIAQNAATTLSVLYRRHIEGLYRYIYWRVGNAEDAEDLSSQVFLDVIDSFHRYHEQNKFASWLFTIARRAVADYYRRRRDDLPLDQSRALSLEGNPVLNQIIHNESLQQLAHLISQLDSEDRELLHLRFAADLRFSDIAIIVGRSEAATKMAIYRILRRLRIAWEESSERGKRHELPPGH